MLESVFCDSILLSSTIDTLMLFEPPLCNIPFCLPQADKQLPEYKF